MSNADPASEIELKLLASSAAPLRALARAASLGRFQLRRRGAVQLHTTYLDTAQRTLLRNGVALRLRHHGGRAGAWEVTAKWSGRVTNAVHVRREINVALAQAPPSPFVLPPGELRDELDALVLGRPLRPILVTAIRRQLFDLLDGESSIAAELALDTVRHGRDADDLRDPYFEVEVELRGAALGELHSLAEILAAEYGLQPAADSKLQRALRDVLGPRTLARSAVAAVDAADSWTSAARKLFAVQLERLRANDPRVRRGAEPDPEAIHEMRVATRRLRSLCRIFAAGLSPHLRAGAAAELHWLGNALGRGRDLDVQLVRLTAARPGGPALEIALAPYREKLRQERRTAVAALRDALASPRYRRLLLQLERFTLAAPRRARGQAAAEPLTAAAATSLAEGRRALRRHDKRARRDRSASAFHKLRIRLRRLRYLVEFLAPILAKEARPLVARLTAFQDLLGDANDQIVLARHLRAHLSHADADSALVADLAENLLLDAGRQHERFRRRWKRERTALRRETRALLRSLRRHIHVADDAALGQRG